MKIYFEDHETIKEISKKIKYIKSKIHKAAKRHSQLIDIEIPEANYKLCKLHERIHVFRTFDSEKELNDLSRNKSQGEIANIF